MVNKFQYLLCLWNDSFFKIVLHVKNYHQMLQIQPVLIKKPLSSDFHQTVYKNTY
jgi:hypothetical protein